MLIFTCGKQKYWLVVPRKWVRNQSVFIRSKREIEEELIAKSMKVAFRTTQVQLPVLNYQ